MEYSIQEKARLMKTLFILAILICAYVAILTFSEIKKDSMLGESTTPATISFTGHGEVQAVPDIATISFTISKDAKTVKDAQAGVAEVEKKALDFLKSKSVAEKDIKTNDASFYPKYEYQQSACPPIPMGAGTAGVTVSPVSPYYCPPNGKQVITGYTASESITVKIRNTDDSGTIMQGLGTTGVSNLNGPSFSIDNEDGIRAEARKKAIDDAKAKAQVLARDLGVSLGKISSFSESGAGVPMMYAKDSMVATGAALAPAPAQIPKGENTISSDVTITYEIR